MTEISLRAYIRDIDNLIETEKLDEAIAHCRHVLQTYPKHLETYRLLGKSYLEAKRYGDAADIFQRVLSAAPDDFVAHIGMAIVREDEGNLDAAIWHMERAFETNPANPAIQQELRRLIGRRDGLEPHKVRLTRGALARMYAHGELYQQAIAELRYGTIAINAWAALAFALGQTSWGAYPGRTLEDIQSGIGAVHNTRLFDKPQKSVVYAPFRVEPRPLWFVTHKNAHRVAPKLVAFEASPSVAKLPGIVIQALRS